MANDLPASAQPRVAAGALFVNDAGEVLLVKPTYKGGWDIPGGYVEPGETPIEACTREVKEELDLEVAVSRLLVADWAPSPHEGDKVLFVFDGGALPDLSLTSIQLPADELAEWSFHSRDAFQALMPERLARRVSAALDAAASGKCAYLEHGYEPGS